MAKRDKSFPEKMKSFFRRAESSPYNFDGMQIEPHVVTLDVLKDISKENSTSHRLKALRELYDHVLNKKLADHAVEAICVRIEDLVGPQQPLEVRHEVFQFYCALILGQNEYMYMMRTYLFRMIICHNIQEDISPRLEMLKSLTNDGKNISYFEEEIGPFLLHRFLEFMVPELSNDFLKLVTNLIKFNAAYLDDEIIEGYINHVLKMCCQSSPIEDIQEGLNILEAVVCYSHLPRSVLGSFISILCITINTEILVECSWKQMRNLLGTNLGIPGIYFLCSILQEMKQKQANIRGAIYFIGMALWDTNRVPALKFPPNAILPSFLKVLETKSFVIAREVLLALTRLVVVCSDLLEYRCMIWDTIFEIVGKIQAYPEFQNFALPMDPCVKELNDFITAAEENHATNSYESLSTLVDNYSILRSDQSIIRLVLYRAENISSCKPNFLLNLNKLLDKFFKNEKRSSVQLELLKALRDIRLLNLRVLDDDVLDQAILQNLINSDGISDAVVRKAVVEFLIVMAESITSNLFLDVLDILERIMRRMLENFKVPGSDASKESHSDAIAVVEGLVYVFKKKLFMMPTIHCVEVFTLFVKHLQLHYLSPSYNDEAVKVRKQILEFFFDIRANKYKQVGVLSCSGAGHCVYLMCDAGPSREPGESVPSSPLPTSPSGVTPSVSYLSFSRGFQVLISSLKEERDWGILEMVLREVASLLQNKSLILRSNCGVGTLCSIVCQMINVRSNGVYENLRNTPARFTRTEFHGYVFPCAVAFTSYHSNMESHIQRLLIRSLQSGLVSRSAKICIEGLTLCLLEMQNSMNKLLPDVLLKLSKISATKVVAVTVLEFLSNLIRLPHLYVTFVEDQYMSIFAIALPYTNPFKFNQYTVALAHHVLSMWFLKCRIPFRRDFAKFITKGLRSNIKLPRVDCKSTSSQSSDQSGAKARDEKGSSSQTRNHPSSPREDSLTEEERTELAILELHTELMETGLDLMTRFTFGMCTNLPQRSPVAEFLLEKGQKSSWLVGNKIITITTSGCGTKTFKHGLCELCYTASHEMIKTECPDTSESVFTEQEATEAESEPKEFLLQRKRHRSAVQRRNTTLSEEIATSANKSKDDIQLHYPRSQEKTSRRNTSYLPDTDRFTSMSTNETDKDKHDRGGNLCSCWCTSWAEVHIRRPTGNTSWMMKIQNRLFLPSSPLDVPISVLESLVLPHIEKEPVIDESPPESDAISVLESEMKELSCEGAIEIAPNPKSTPPMRRTNSSPDMNTGWFSSLESKHSSLEGGAELEQEQSKSKEPASSAQPSSLKQRVPDKSKSKNLKLDFAPFSKGKSSSTESGPRFQRESIDSAPIGKTQHSATAHPQPSTSGSFRDRGHTISVMSPNRPTGADTSTKTSEVNPRNGMSPSFVFLQLYQNSIFGITSPKPLLIPHCETNNRALTVLDHIPPYDCHKIGVVYVGPGQVDDEVAILSNTGGSSRYVDFLRGLGRLVKLKDTDPHTTYLGGLDTRGEDGDYALIWHDDVMQVVFHEATFMRNKESDKMRNEKKKHIANDYVMIAYNEGGADFNVATIKGHVTNACIVVKPEDFNCNVVTVSHKTAEMKESFGHTESYVVSDESLPVFVRQMALHANLASMLISRRLQGSKYTQVSNWLERLRAIKRLRSKVEEEWKAKNAETYAFESEPSDYTDFTDYV